MTRKVYLFFSNLAKIYEEIELIPKAIDEVLEKQKRTKLLKDLENFNNTLLGSSFMMEIAALTISGITAGIVLFQFFIIRKNFEKIEKEIKKLRAIVNKLSFDLLIDRLFESTGEVARKKISELGERIFELLKKKYNMNDVTTYMEMKKRIEKMEMDEEEKAEIMEFLNAMIYLEYSAKTLSTKRKEKLRKILVRMLRKVAGSQQALEQG